MEFKCTSLKEIGRYLKDVSKVGRDRGENDFMSLKGRSIGAGQGDVDKVMPGVEVTKRGGHVDREVVPLEAVLLRAAHDCNKRL